MKVLMLILGQGELVIAEVDEGTTDDLFYTLVTPGLVLHERGPHGSLGFLLVPWMPQELLSHTLMRLDRSAVKGEVSPSKEFVSFYTVWAAVERDKLKLHAADFRTQIRDIERSVLTRFTKHSRGRQSFITAFDTIDTLPEDLIDLFENAHDNGWGNPSVTN